MHIYINVYIELRALVLRICVCVCPQTTINLSSYYYICLYIHIRMYICIYTYIHLSASAAAPMLYKLHTVYIYNMYTSTTHACGRGELPLELEAEAALFEFATNYIHNIHKIHSGRGWCGLRTAVGAGGGGRAVGVRDDSRRRVRVRD